MRKLITYTLLVPALLLLAYVLTVQVLRAIAMGEEERTALALMEPLPPPPAGVNGFKYLAFPGLDVPPDELDAAMAAELAAFREWHEGSGPRSLVDGGSQERFVSPAAARYPRRPSGAPPATACNRSRLDCLESLRGEDTEVRAWLTLDAANLVLAEQALGADTMANPFPLAVDMPMPAYQWLQLPVNAAAIQALDGDVAGAMGRTCAVLATGRRFLAQDGSLVDKMVHVALTDNAGALLLSLRREHPDMPLPRECEEALAPVDASHYRLCGVLKAEHAMLADYTARNDEAMAKGPAIRYGLVRLLLTDATLMRGWNAMKYAPFCSAEGLALVDAGKVPAQPVLKYEMASVDYWAAPISHLLASISVPDYGKYQRRLLDSAAMLRLHLAGIAVAEGRLAPAGLPAAASSPGYAVQVQGGDWVMPLSEGARGQPPERRIPIPVSPTP